MSGVAKKLMSAAGAGAGGGFTAIEDVFSTYLYTGNSSTQTITNGIDLAGEGGLVWIKARNAAINHYLYDTERGATKELSSNLTDAEATALDALTSFNSDGFSLGADNGTNKTSNTHASWTFRKAPRFFDVVTYTGNGVPGHVINHSLGCDVGTVIIKQTNASRDWAVWHRSGGVNPGGKLNSTQAFGYTWVSSTSTTSITLENEGIEINGSGQTYVAYLFAHDPLGPSEDGSDGLIACGSFTTDGSGNATVDLGFEPQFVINKTSSSADNWTIADSMRGFNAIGDQRLYANLSNAEATATTYRATSTGFTVNSGETSKDFIYIAIRRGPMRAPTSGTEVFAMDTLGGTAPNPPGFNSGFPVDLGFYKGEVSGANWVWGDRLRGAVQLSSASTAAEASNAENKFDYMNGWNTSTAVLSNYPSWMFRRAPGFFDVVAYTGTGSVSTFAHNLGVKPQMIWTKGRNDSTYGWYVYHEAVTAEDQLYLHLTNAAGGGFMNNTEPTDEVFTLGVTSGANASGQPFIAYLFATLPGVSKVGSYTGNGSSQTINCGFTGGARFVLIKRTDSTGDWYVWDTARGIVAGNDPHLSLNTTAAEVTTDDSIDPDSSGFIVNQLAATNINVSSASYIYLAIA